MICSYAYSSASVVISKNAVWKYKDDGSNQGTAWKNVGFNDNKWLTGAAELGFNDSPVTALQNGNITYYFRKKVTLANPSQYSSFTFYIRRDDGILLYVNGVEVFRNNMPSGSISNTTYASSLCSDDGATVLTLNLPSSAFVNGTNVVAAEVHNHILGTADLTFELELLSNLPAVLPVVTRGPYIQSTSSSSTIIKWRTDVPTDSKVNYGFSTTVWTVIKDTVMTTEHEVKITGLQSNAKYFYRVGSTAVTLLTGPKYFFQTAPPQGTIQPVRVWALGDFGNGSVDQGQVLQSYQNYLGASRNDMWIWLGDNAYYYGTDSEYTSQVFNVYGGIFRSWNFYPAPGNHDYGQSGYQSAAALGTGFPYFSIFSLPVNAVAGGVPSGTEKYYSYNWGNVHFIALDSYGALNQPGSPMYNWLQSDLQNNHQKWIIAYWHHPPYSKGTHNSDTEVELIDMRQNIVPLLEQYGVDLVLNGHSHTYERSFFMHGHYGNEASFDSTMIVQSGDGSAVPYIKDLNHNGTVYAVCGVGGQVSASSTPGYPHNAMIASYTSVAGSLVLDIFGDTLRYKFLKSDGTIADSFTMIKLLQPRYEHFGVDGQEMPAVFPGVGENIYNIYPGNPALKNLRIYDLSGQLLLKDEVYGLKTVELGFLKKGIYLFDFSLGSQHKTVKVQGGW